MDPRLQAFNSPDFDRVFGAVASLPGAAEEETLDVPSIDADARAALAAALRQARRKNPDPASRLLLIKGAAGTGKTHTLLTAMRQHHAAGEAYGVILPMVDPVDEAEFDAWLTHAIVTRLREPYLAPAGAPVPLNRLTEALLAAAPPDLAAQFRDEALDGAADMPPEAFRRLIQGIRAALSGPQRIPPASEAFIAALLANYAGLDDGLEYLRGNLREEIAIWGVRLPQRAHERGARALIEQLAAVAGATGGALIIAFDQLEQNRLERWEDRLRHIVGRGALLAETLPSLAVIFAVIPALYDSIAHDIDRSIRDRIETFGATPVSLRNLSRPNVELFLRHRLAALYAQTGAPFDASDPLYPFGDEFLDELSGQTSRYVIDMVQAFRRFLAANGRAPSLDDLPPPQRAGGPAPGAGSAAPAPSIDYGDAWERQLAQTIAPPAPAEAFAQADLIEWAIHAALTELPGVKRLSARKVLRARTLALEVEIEAADGKMERRDIAICNDTSEGANLGDEIASFLANCREARPVIVRPRGRPLPKTGRGAGAILRGAEEDGAIIVRQFDKLSWERLQIAKTFFIQKDYPGFMDWQRRAKPLTQIPPIAAILQWPYVKPDQKPDEEEGRAREAKAPLHAPTGAAVMLGDAQAGRVYWSPFEAENRLLNFGLLVTGDPGSGKTQTLNVLIDGVVDMGFPVCIFDFKKDYVSPDFVAEQRLRVHDVRRDGLPFNPLLPSPERDGRAKPVEHIFTICGVLKRVFRLGDQQEAKLRDAMKLAFERRGIDTQSWIDVAAVTAPCFDDVIEVLREYEEQRDNTSRNLLNRLSPLFELGLFPRHEAKGGSFETMLGERLVLALFDLPSKEIQSALAELIIIRLHGFLVRGDHPRKLTRLMVLDEAWRVAGSTHLESLAREGRAFGVGLAIGTQYPGDLPPDLSGALDTKIFLKNQQPDHKKAVVRALCGATSGPEAAKLHTLLEGFGMFEGVIQNQQYRPYQKFKLAPYYARRVRSAAE